jgi:hypothetical protein
VEIARRRNSRIECPVGRWCLIGVAILAAGCETASFEKARAKDTIEAYRDYLRNAPPGDRGREPARERLAVLEFERARLVDTPVSYKRFIEEFPESDRREQAEVLLESLRFEAAREKGTIAAYEDFLRDHPAGHHAQEAHDVLAKLELDVATKAGTAAAYEAFLSRNPATPARTDIERKIDDAVFAEAKDKGPAALFAYLADRPDGGHREEARAILRRREALARALAGDVAGAYAEAQKTTGAEAAALDSAIEEVEYQIVAATLDPAALTEFANQHPGRAGVARAAAAALRKDGGTGLKALAARLDPGREARPAEELLRALEAPDPRDRWLAAEELGRIGSLMAIDRLLGQVAVSRFLKVRFEAFRALAAIVASIPPEGREAEIQRRLGQIRPVERGGDLLIKVAVLEELSGSTERALSDYQRVSRIDEEDLFAWWRVAELRAQRGDALGRAVAARTIAVEVEAFVHDRSREGSVPLLYARTLCGLREETQVAQATLAGLPPAAARDFPEDLVSFQTRTIEAARLVAAKLSDAEAESRGSDKYFRSCDDDDVAPRMDEGDADRLAAVRNLASLHDKRAIPALQLAASRDPSEKVRRAAQEALGGAAASR